MLKLKELLCKVTSEYANELQLARTSNNYKRPLGNIVRKEIPRIIEKALDPNIYCVKGSVGAGRWTNVPWIAIFDKRITKSAQNGVYIVYLFNKDKKTLYLTLNQGATNVSQNGGIHSGEPLFTGIASTQSPRTINALEQNAKTILKRIKPNQNYTLPIIDTGSRAYDAGCIIGIRYDIDTIPEDDKLFNDLNSFIEYYQSYYQSFISTEKVIVKANVNGEKDNMQTLIKDEVESIARFIISKGFTYPGSLIENFYLSLKSKPFVILAGTSGTGKTKLVKLFAEAIGAEYKLVSVHPDWSDSSDLFGHVDLNGKFNEGVILSFVKDAEIHPNTPFFLCLDEMNLARVEYYLSDILSVIETREMTSDGRITTDPLVPAEVFGSDDKAKGKFGVVSLPDNLYIVGTVNMDETTFPFSKKVLDRANTIEFSYVDLVPDFDDTGIEAKPQMLSNDFLKTRYLILKQDCTDEAEYVTEKCEKLQAINEILKEADAHIGYRVRDEIVFYMLNNRQDALLSEEEALDNEIMQKILPRVQGGSSAVKNMLLKLFVYLAGDYSGYADGKAIYEQMRSFLENKGTSYPRSAEKIMYMVRRYEEDGFTSYWL